MKSRVAILLIVSTTLFAACAPATPIEPTPDVLAIRTSAAKTVVADLHITTITTITTPTTTQRIFVIITSIVIGTSIAAAAGKDHLQFFFFFFH